MNREEFLKSRKRSIGGSDAASVVNAGNYGCARRLVYDKLDYTPDFDDSDKAEFRRGRRLESVAVAYYEELTGRVTRATNTIQYPGKPHLTVNMDRLVYADDKDGPGYLEIKVVGRGSFIQIKKNGLPDDYAIQVQHGCAVAALKWGAFGIYCPETDELLHWDFVADEKLGATLLEAADDLWTLNIENRIIPNPLPEGSKPCGNCKFTSTCRGELKAKDAAIELILRPDLEAKAVQLAEMKGIASEAEDAANGLKEEILDLIKHQPGKYKMGKYVTSYTETTQLRFSGEELKKKDPALYESLRKPSLVKSLKTPKEE